MSGDGNIGVHLGPALARLLCVRCGCETLHRGIRCVHCGQSCTRITIKAGAGGQKKKRDWTLNPRKATRRPTSGRKKAPVLAGTSGRG